MALAHRYFEALLLCEELEQRGLVNLIMPESNLLLSDRLQGVNRQRAIDALNVYVRAYNMLKKANLAAGFLCLAIGVKLLIQTLA